MKSIYPLLPPSGHPCGHPSIFQEIPIGIMFIKKGDVFDDLLREEGVDAYKDALVLRGMLTTISC